MGWLDGLLGGMSGIGSSIGGALGSMFKQPQQFSAPARQFGGGFNMGGPVGGVANMVKGSMQPGGALGNFGSALSGLFGTKSASAQPVSSSYNRPMQSPLNNNAGSLMQPGTSLMGSSGGQQPGFLQKLLGSWGSKGLDTLQNDPMKLIGGAMSLFGGTKTPPNQVPQMTQSPAYGMLSKQAMSGGGPMSILAQQKLTERLNQTQQDLGQPEIDAINRSFEQDQAKELDQMNDYYKSIRPGSDPIMDSTYQRDLQQINDKYARAKSDAIAQAQRGIGQNFENNRIRQIAAATGLDQVSSSQLMQIAQMDIAQIMAQFNISREDAMNLKDYAVAEGDKLFFGQPQVNVYGGNSPLVQDSMIQRGGM